MSDTNEITENQVLEMAALVSNKVEEMTGQPISESDNFDLAIRIQKWLYDSGFTLTTNQ